MTVKNDTEGLGEFEVPASVMAEAAIEEAKRILYTFGVLPDEYKQYYAQMYAKDATQEGREREAKSTI